MDIQMDRAISINPLNFEKARLEQNINKKNLPNILTISFTQNITFHLHVKFLLQFDLHVLIRIKSIAHNTIQYNIIVNIYVYGKHGK